MEEENSARVGIISIPPEPRDPEKLPFAHFYTTLGSNTGNMMFTVAVHRQMRGNVERVSFGFDPKKVNSTLDYIVIPCANWLNPRVEWDWFCDLLEQVEIPVIPIGLGLQSPHSDLDRVSISASSERLAHIFSKKAPFISVRGDFTRNYLHSVGIDNVVTTGCPSLYMRICDEAAYDPEGEVAILPTRYPIRQDFIDMKSLNNGLFKVAAKHDLDIIYQSEREEMEYLFYRNRDALFPENFPDGLQQVYGFENPDQLVDYIDRKGRSFTDLKEWVAYTQTKAGIIGTRLHGSILALNAGCPAVLFAHDSRTAEMIEFASLPTALPPDDVESLDPSGLRALINPDDYDQYVRKRQENARIYRDFLDANGVGYNEDGMY